MACPNDKHLILFKHHCMKTYFPALLSFCLLVLSSCTKEHTAPELRRETAEKMIGKWVIDHTVSEVYDPLPLLNSTDTYIGTANDYYNFKTDGYVGISSAVLGQREETYTVFNPYQVNIADRGWWIDKLSSTELLLVQDVNDVVQYKRYVTKIYLKK